MKEENTTFPAARVPALHPLPRIASFEEWEQGRAARRALSEQLSGGRLLRRNRGDDEAKDALLRSLNGGQRGMPFYPLAT